MPSESSLRSFVALSRVYSAVLVSVGLLGLASCAGGGTAPDPMGGGAIDPALSLPAVLHGQEVEEERAGAWTVRRAGHSRAGGSRDDCLAPSARPVSSAAPAEEMVAEDRVAEYRAADPGMVAGGLERETKAGAESGFELRPREKPEATAAPLRAGSTDDNADFDAYLAFLDDWTSSGRAGENFEWLDVAVRRFVRVVDSEGRPVPAARVEVLEVDGDRTVRSGRTYGDGRMPFYPRLQKPAPEGSVARIAQGPFRVDVSAVGPDGETLRKRVEWSGSTDEFTVHLDGAVARGPVQLDVVFAIDTTGSMGDEIARIKQSLLAMTDKLRSLDLEFDLRYGAVLYRDVGDEYVTKAHPFTADIEAFADALQGITAAGGGDGPESLNQALAVTVGRMGWRANAAKVAFLVADAPPHLDYEGDVHYGFSAQAALQRGIRVHSVAASGLDGLGTLVFRQVAQLTRGKFVFIEYGSAEKSAASHGVGGKVSSNNLDDILFEQIRDEVAGWGRSD